MDRTVREPIQTYLSEEERAELDRAAEALGVSRSEALRRGIRALARKRQDREPTPPDVITPAKAPPGAPPPSIPVAPLAEILRELEQDRGER